MQHTYRKHGQVTTVVHDKTWRHLLIDCGGMWLKHDKDAGTYRYGMYGSDGYFTSLRWITRAEFIRYMQQALKHLSRDLQPADPVVALTFRLHPKHHTTMRCPQCDISEDATGRWARKGRLCDTCDGLTRVCSCGGSLLHSDSTELCQTCLDKQAQEFLLNNTAEQTA